MVSNRSVPSRAIVLSPTCVANADSDRFDGIIMPMRMTVFAMVLTAASALTGAGARAQDAADASFDGIYEGGLRCEASGGRSPATTEPILVAVLNGRARYNSASESWRLSVSPDGSVTAAGVLRVAGIERPGGFVGSVKGARMRLEGHRGGRNCVGELIRAASPRPVGKTDVGYDPAERRRLLGRPNSGRTDPFVCPPTPQPSKDLRVDGFYAADASASVIDPQAMARYRDVTAPLGSFQEGLTRIADRDLATAPRDPLLADCALGWLDSWASADALLGPLESRQSRYERKWFASTVALVYAQLRRDGAPGTPEQAARIQRWLRSLAYAILPDYALPNTDTVLGRLSSARNNHLNWAALAAVAVGEATLDGALIDWGVSRARVALREVDADGYLPLELQRRSKARHYHLFALKPLILLAEIALADGIDLYQAEGGAMHRLARRCLEGIADPSGFVDRAGAEQEYFQRDVMTGSDIAWLEAYDARFPAPDQTALLTQYRSVRDRRLGGDMTRRFSPPTPAPN